MSEIVSGGPGADHPRHRLAFFVTSSICHAVRTSIAEFVARLGKSRSWLLGPPRHIDEHEVPEDQTLGDCCVDHVGAFIEIYSTWPPWTVPREIDRQQLNDATALLAALVDFSIRERVSFEIEFADEMIGDVADGKMNGVRELLLDDWQRSLG